MTPEDEKLLADNGWVVECESPFEIRTKDGSFATNEAASIVLHYLKKEGEGGIDLIDTLANAFSTVSGARRDLEDHCVHDEDRQRARLRSCICMDIAEALRNANKTFSNE